MKNQSVSNNLDWSCVVIFIVLVVLGWMNIYSSSVSLSAGNTSIFDISQVYGKQMLFVFLTVPIIFVVLFADSKFYEKYSSLIFGIALLLLAGLFVAGKTIAGQRCWYGIGSFTLQPSEFAKAATALALAKFLSDVQVNLGNVTDQLKALAIIFLPVILILPQPDPGSALIYTVFFFVLFREGLPGWYLGVGFAAIILFVMALLLQPIYIILIAALILIFVYFKTRIINRSIVLSTFLLALITGFVYSVDYVFSSIFKQHHRDRFNILLGKAVDMKGIGYNTNQSEIAIGSGGFFGKGYLEGTQTKGGFVPEQHTDYIFTTVGEEWGFFGSLIVLGLFIALILRILYLSERQKTKFSRVYGY